MSDAPAVRRASLVREPLSLLVPLLLMALLWSLRGVCRLVQAAIPLAGLLVPMGIADAVDLSGRRVR